MMNSKQIEELNMLLVDHSETLTAFSNGGIGYGMHKGCVVGVVGGAIGSVVGMAIAYGFIGIIFHRKKKIAKMES